MMTDDYTAVGRLLKPHGLQGEIKLWVEEPFLDPVWESELLFLEEGGRPLPFFIESIRGKGNPIIKFEEVNSRADAALFSRKDVFLKNDYLARWDLPSVGPTADKVFVQGLLGYTLIDEQLGEIGPISRLEEYPQQWMAVLEGAEGERLIPLIEAFILEIDREKGCIRMNLPDGLLDI